MSLTVSVDRAKLVAKLTDNLRACELFKRVQFSILRHFAQHLAYVVIYMLTLLNNLLQTNQIFVEANDIEQVQLPLLRIRDLREVFEFLAESPLFQIENAVKLIKLA